jgi:hypothetical protein
MRIALLSLVLSSPSVLAQQPVTTVAARTEHGAQPAHGIHTGSVSSDGRWTLFDSDSDDIVRGDTNGVVDSFLHDRVTGKTERVSVSSSGVQLSRDTYAVQVSADGRWVLMNSEADELAPGGSALDMDGALRDRQTGAIAVLLTGVGASRLDSQSMAVAMTPDARYVVVDSPATNVLPGTPLGVSNVYVIDRIAGVVTYEGRNTAGQPADGGTYGGAITADGRYLMFSSDAGNLSANDTNGEYDAYLRDRLLGTTTLVSANSLGNAGTGYAGFLSSDARYASFVSFSDLVVPGDDNRFEDIFVRDMWSGTVELVSRNAAGQIGNGPTVGGFLSADGRKIGLLSFASNFAPGVAGNWQAYVKDRVTGAIECVSVSTQGVPAPESVNLTAMSPDGRRFSFTSNDALIGSADLNGIQQDLLLRDLDGGAPTVGSYCIAGANSAGCAGLLEGFGIPDANAGSGFSLVASGVQGKSVAIVHYGVSGPYIVPFGASYSVRCVRPPLQRTRVLPTGGTAGSCSGKVSLDWNEFIATNPQALGAPFLGSEGVWAQVWVRDPGSMIGGVFTNAVWFTVAP